MKHTCVFETQLISGNSRLMPSGNHDRWMNSPRYSKCKQDLALHFGAHMVVRNVRACRVSIRLSRRQWRGDLDNGAKVILDALERACVIQNDKYIEDLHVKRSSERVSEVEVEAL